MEALTISAANLDTIEKNLGHVADTLSGVITNVNSVNSQVNKVEDQVASLNDEVKSLVKEIRETTIITNARQNIMYNNEVIDKKFNYYDSVRRITESLLDAIVNSSISKKSLYSMNQNLLLNNPNYWLSNALAALSYWVLDDRDNTQREVNNALKKNPKKTSLFLAIVNLKLDRTDTGIRWLRKYLNSLNPLELDKDFITVLDMTATGVLNDKGKEMVLDKISDWFRRLQNDKEVIDRQNKIWHDFILDNQDSQIYMPYTDMYVSDNSILKHNLRVTSTYHNVFKKLNNVVSQEHSVRSLDEILNNLIYDYEDKEQVYQLDNLRNSLIIACNGDTEKASKMYKKQESMYLDRVDLITILGNIVLYDTNYKIGDETKKLALSLVKNYIIKAYQDINNSVIDKAISLNINGFILDINHEIDRNIINNELNLYLEKEIVIDDKDLIITLFILNILGIIGIFITLDNRILNFMLIGILIIGNIFLFNKMNKRNKIRINSMNRLRESINNNLDSVLAEIIDYYSLLKGDKIEYDNLNNWLNSLSNNDYIKSNNERNIIVG